MDQMYQMDQIPAIPSQSMTQETMKELFYNMAKTVQVLGNQIEKMAAAYDNNLERQIASYVDNCVDLRIDHYFNSNDDCFEELIRSQVEDAISNASISINV